MAKKTGEKLELLKEKFSKEAVDKRVRENMPFTHYWHNRFHVEAPFGLISDPNGLAFCNGEHHIFCQWNPLTTDHKNKSWMHTKTPDFIHYSMQELSLWPTDIHDKDGCHSGCGFVEDGKLRVFYTCNSRDEDYIRTVAQRFGTLKEDGHVEKEEIVIHGNPEGYSAHFRDPNFFYRNGERYFAMAAQRLNKPGESSRPTNGTVLIYKEENGKNCKLLGEVKTEYRDFGYMWECPNILQFDDYDVLIMCPQGLEPEEFQYQSHCQAGYLVGHFSIDSLEMLHGKFQELDHGFDFYSPQVFRHEGRHILVGWIGMPDLVNEIESAKEGWLYSLTMPRVLTLRQGRIYSAPVEELKALRKEETEIELDTNKVDFMKETLPKTAEVILDIKTGEAKNFEIALNYGEEKTVITYDKNTQVMIIDRNGMKLGGKGQRKFKLYVNEELSFRMFVDRTAIEIFLQHGEDVATFFVYPEKDVAPELTIKSDKEMAEVHGTIWELDSIKFS